MPTPIQKFPEEVLLAIFENFCGHCSRSEECICGAHDDMPSVEAKRRCDQKQRLNLALTCREFQPAALQVLYHAPSLDKIRIINFPAEASPMLDLFRASLSFAPYVKKFVFRATDGAPEGLGVPTLSTQLAMFPNLEEAHLKISFDDGVHLPADFRLPHLKRASIEGDPRTWSLLEGRGGLLERASRSLDLLSLKYIFISVPALPCQNVTTLHLRHVMVEKPALCALFRRSFPRLQTLSWQCSIMASPADAYDDRATWGFFEAIVGLKETLVHLDLIDGRLSFAEAAVWLPRMTALQTLSLPGR